MLKMPMEEIISAVNGHAPDCDPMLQIDHVSTNSKTARGSSLFIALRGERFDGHDFTDDFYRNGGQAVITEQPPAHRNAIVVEDTRLALGALARHYRGKFSVPLVGITGSVGKTSTRGMITGVLSIAGATHSTGGNLNNDIGLPMTLFGLERPHKFAVIEMGMNHAGEISYLSNIAKPTVAVITNIGTAHIGNLGSKEAILSAKLEILDGLAPGGVIILNGDDELLWGARDRIAHRAVFYGIDNPKCDYKASDVALASTGSSFSLENERVEVPAPGRHHVYNAMAAAAVGSELGLSLAQIKEGVARFESGGMRQEIIGLGGVMLIEDCYNANADSMKSALEVLSSLGAGGRKIAVLGDMYELGAFTQSEHRRVGDCAAENRVDLLITVGKLAGAIAAQAALRGIETHTFEDNQAALRYLNSIVTPGDAVLVKASRGAKFEEISRGLQQSLRS